MNKQVMLHHGDCLEVMKDIESGSVDAIITDPPYGTTACKWDSVIPFDAMWEQLNRIIKPTGAIVLFGSEPFSSALRMSNIKNYKYDWIWIKGVANGVQHARNMPLKKNELVSIFSDGGIKHAGQKGRMTYNPQGVKPPTRKITGVESTKKSEHRLFRACTVEGKAYKGSNYPNSILSYTNASNKERGLHPTQKPVALMEYLIKTYTNEAETVLDFTMGSGTTGVACKNLNRNFIGIELDENYFNIAKERIETI